MILFRLKDGYTKLFKFIDGVYTAPDFSNRGFIVENVISNLKNTIVGMDLQRDFLKTCNTYAVGYGKNTTQILRSDCIYTGIRDLRISLDAVRWYADMSWYIKSVMTDHQDIGGYVKTWNSEDTRDLSGILKGFVREAYSDIPGYIKEIFRGSTDLMEYLNIVESSEENISSTIKGFSRYNERNLSSIVKGWDSLQSNLYSYIKSTTNGSFDLGSIIHKIWQVSSTNLSESLHGWQISDLNNTIQVLSIADIGAIIRAKYIADLSAILHTIQPVDIQASLRGWATKDIGISLSGGLGPTDVSVYINGVAASNLSVSIFCKLGIGVPVSLPVSVWGVNKLDLPVFIYPISAVDLPIFITSRSNSVDLHASIYPKVIFVKRLIDISFLEARDLSCIINNSCVSSGYRDFTLLIDVMHSSNLRGVIFGNAGTNIQDLSIRINSGEYVCVNSINIKSILNEVRPTTYLNVSSQDKQESISFDTIDILRSDYPISSGDRTTEGSALRLIESQDLYINKIYDFEDSTPTAYWSSLSASVVVSSIPIFNKSLFFNFGSGSNPVRGQFNPPELVGGSKIEYLEFCYLRSYIDKSVGVKIFSSSGELLVGVVPKYDSSLAIYVSGAWTNTDIVPVSGIASWYMVRIIFDWDNDSFSIVWVDIAANNTYTVNPITMPQMTTKNVCSLSINAFNGSDWLIKEMASSMYFDNFYFKNIDYIPVLNASMRDLKTTITGDYIKSDLGAKISAYTNPHYENDSVRQRVVVLKFTNNSEEWRRQVDIVFNNYASSYYYFSGNKKAYKAVRDEHWVVEVEGFDYATDIPGIERKNIRKKFIFNLSQYKTIDAAIRDMISRVTVFSVGDMGCTINPIQPTCADLSVSIKTAVKYKTNRRLSAIIKSVSIENSNMSVDIEGVLNKDVIDLSATITGTDYEAPQGDMVNFNIEEMVELDDPDLIDLINFNFSIEGLQ